jgi:sugar phosphate isomerase/epimerase
MKHKEPDASDRSRRELFRAGALAAASILLGEQTRASLRPQRKPKRHTVHVFSKHLQWLDYDGMAETAAEIGFDGVDLTVRPGGHVLPERAEDDLPRAIEAAQNAGIEVAMMTTAITDPRDPLTRSILATASRLGIRYYRMGYYRYEDDTPIPNYLEEIKPVLADLAAMNEHYGIAGSYQNHAGARYVGAPLWDLYGLLKDRNPRWVGSQYDIRHATVEGGTSWPTTLRLLAPYINTLVAKDFRWLQEAGKARAENCPLGDGMVDFPAYCDMLKREKIAGPMSLHLEYPLGGAEHGARRLATPAQTVTDAMRKDLSKLRTWLSQRSL